VKQRLTDLRFQLRDALPERRRRQRDGARRGAKVQKARSLYKTSKRFK